MVIYKTLILFSLMFILDDNGGSSETLSLIEIVYGVYSIRIGNEIIEQTTPTTLERQITENLRLHFNTALNSVLLNDEYSDYTHRHSISCEIQDRISHGYTCHEELVNFHNTLVENPSNILNIEKIQTKTLDYLIKKM